MKARKRILLFEKKLFCFKIYCCLKKIWNAITWVSFGHLHANRVMSQSFHNKHETFLIIWLDTWLILNNMKQTTQQKKTLWRQISNENIVCKQILRQIESLDRQLAHEEIFLESELTRYLGRLRHQNDTWHVEDFFCIALLVIRLINKILNFCFNSTPIYMMAQCVMVLESG